MGEKFSANPVTGTGSLSVPIYTSPGRSGFGPQLSISYDSGAGSGPFGFGWSLSLPAVTRKTDRGLPEYRDAEESDVYLLSGAEDLVPVLQPDGSRFEDTTTAPGYTIHRYRPRIEGLFARIERWTRLSDGDVHWHSISRDNILTIYGKDENSRIADPADPRRVFTWLICETRDDKGNAILYEYKPEDGAHVDLTRAHERNRGDRNDPRRKTNRYLKRIRYGNRVPLLHDAGQRPRFLTDAQIQDAGWMFEVVFDYGEHEADVPKPDDAGAWAYRNDPFSSYRAGFEVRTCRLCQRVLMFHHFEDETGVGKDCLVRSTDFTYSHEQDPNEARNPVYTFLLAATQTGYKRNGGGYLKRSLPPVEFGYTQPIVQDRVHDVDAESLENLPVGLDGAVYQWTDLHGEGIPGILAEQGAAWFYKRNLSPINVKPGNAAAHTEAKFAPAELVAAKPSLSLSGGQAQFMDLAGDGQPDLVVLDDPTPGLYEHDGDEGWQPFRPFTSRLNRDTRDPNLRFVDLDGDGHADVLITEDNAIVWHASLAEQGFGPARHIHQALSEENGPRLVFADGTQSIYLADLSGDDLTDLVRIRNGEVCYWPNLGYGRFGAKVTMDHAPRFDLPDQFDQRRIRLADIDGTGTTDIIYLHRDGVHLYFNQAGNSWSAPQALSVFPHVDDLAAITPTDLLGNGTACLLWSSPLPGDAGRQMRYVDLMGERKPHLLISVMNNLGAETQIRYAPSIRFYLEDKRAGKPWITKLPFPVHVVERVETYDHISGNRFVTRYAYHHGYFDGEEREFHGFGMVEHFDTEEFAALVADGTLPEATNIDAASHVPPVHTKTWFHTGAFLDKHHISRQFEGEYYREPGLSDAQFLAHLLPDTTLPSGLSAEEEREACRALKGSILRQEIYALDRSEKAPNPYIVSERDYTLKRLQHRGENRHAVFFVHPRETIDYNYERHPADPRITHALTLDVDSYGNVLKGVSIGYGRRQSSLAEQRDRDKQMTPLITYTENSFTRAIDDMVQHPHDFRTPLAAEARSYELTGFKPENNAARFSIDEWTTDGFASLTSAAQIPYEQAADNTTKQKRLIEHVRTLYRKDDLTAFSPLGDVEPLALPGESFKLAFTPGLLAHVFKRKQIGQPDEDLLPNPAQLLEGKDADQGGYVAWDGDWWIPSGRAFFDPEANATNPALTAAEELTTARQHFFVPSKFTDPFGHSTEVDYDTHDLLVTRTRDALGNTIATANDYRVLQPRLVTDPNRNRSTAAFDALGMVVATAVMGKEGENLGDLLEDFDPDPQLADLQAFIADPHAHGATLLGKATTRIVYDLGRYDRAGQPSLSATLARETHFHGPSSAQTRIQLSFSYSDGFGREIEGKVQAEAGDAPQRQADVPLPTGDVHPGDLVRDAQGRIVGATIQRRWVGTGRTVFNNKGMPVRQYEPFFSATHLYEPEREMTDTGVSPVLFYDPLERVVATLHPNHTYEKVVFDPWRQATYDENDAVAASGTQTGDPRTDEDVKGYVRAYFETQPVTWQTWHAQRIGNHMGAAERDAAQKAAAHADTPTVAHLDALGRPFLTLADNGLDPTQPGQPLRFPTRVELDIEGNQRVVIDAKDRIVVGYGYDLLGNRIHQASMEAGERWLLNDVAGSPIHAWDSRRFLRRMTYDELRRPTGLYVTANGVERLAERTVYGESQGDGANHRVQVYQVFDGTGIATSIAYDFKGNLLENRRDLLRDYKQAVDWQQNPPANDGTFTGRATFDALNRPLSVTTPDKSVYRSTFNEANLLDKVEVNLRGAEAITPFVTNIDYDAKGQRKRIEYGNSAFTEYSYDKDTYRLVRLKTTRPTSPATKRVVQDLRYTYDPVGNITHIEDDADIQNVVFFRNRRVEPSADYVYDAVYRLTKATGREHLGQTAEGQLRPPVPTDPTDAPRVGLAHPGDGKAMGRYTETYQYDEVGNIASLVHTASSGGWTRRYAYDEPSLIQQTKTNNRLSTTTVGNQTVSYAHDAHGNMTSMPHLPLMQWDYEDQLRATSKQVVGTGGTPETTYYVYDSAGQRARKVTERQAAPGKEPTRKAERIYLGGYEVYREYNNDDAAVTLERESLNIMDDKQRIALVETRTQGSDPPPESLARYQLGNHLGSASLELDDQAQIISYEEYYPYGSTSYQAGRSAAEVSLKRYRYTGMERDEESGLNYHTSRYYIPWLGRWSSVDSTGLQDGPNLYAYVAGNAISLVDLSGRNGEQPQLWLYEARAFWQKVTATAKGRGFGQKLRNIFTNLARLWGDMEKIHVSHVEKSFFEIRAGETTDVAPEREKANLTRSASERAAAASARQAGRFARVNGVDTVTKAAKRVKQPSLSPALSDPALRRRPPTIPPAPSTPAVANSAAPSAPAANPNQLELPFDKVKENPPAPPTKAPAKPAPRAGGIRQTATKALGVAGLAGLGGEVITDLHEGKPGAAAIKVGIGAAATKVLTKYPALAPLAVMASTIDAFDDKVKEQSLSAGEWVERKTGNRVVGALAASATATGVSVFQGTFGRTGRAIGEGAAAVYIRATSDEYTLVPWKSQLWSDIFD